MGGVGPLEVVLGSLLNIGDPRGGAGNAGHRETGRESPDPLIALAVAEGPVQVGFGESEGENTLRQGIIWEGGRAKRDNPFMLVMNSDQQYARLVSAIADRVNETFQGPYRASGSEIAKPQQTTSFLVLNVPPQYEYNLPRFLRVVRMIPLRERSISVIRALRRSCPPRRGVRQ